jgi:hypothetical protein
MLGEDSHVSSIRGEDGRGRRWRTGPFKVRGDEEGVKNPRYDVSSHEHQIVDLARTTLCNIIGTLTLEPASGER